LSGLAVKSAVYVPLSGQLSAPAGHFGLAVLEAGKDDSDEWDL